MKKIYLNTGLFLLAIVVSATTKPPVSIGKLPDLGISTKPYISQNTDLSISKTLPIVNKNVIITANIHNYGKAASKKSKVVVSAQNRHFGTTFKQSYSLNKIPAAEGKIITIDWLPKKSGLYTISIAVDPGYTSGESNRYNNNLSFEVAVLDKQIYLASWIYRTPNIKYSNLGLAFTWNWNEWLRRGAIPLRWAGGMKYTKKGWNADKMFNHWDEAAKDCIKRCSGKLKGGILIDEFGDLDTEPILIKAFQKFKKKYPDMFVQVWQSGLASYDVAQKMKKSMSLYMMERYLNLGTDLRSFDGAIYTTRKYGIISKTLMAISPRRCDGKNAPAAQIRFIEEQIKYIKKNAPEMPGICIYFGRDVCLPGVDSSSDELAFKYYALPVLSVKPKGKNLISINNCGAMTAYNVKVSAYKNGKLQKTYTIPEIPSGNSKDITTQSSDNISYKIHPEKDYTILD